MSTTLLPHLHRPPLRSSLLQLHPHGLRPQTQTRHATLIRRPHRPYTFTQLLTLSDGSTFVHRTTSPQPLYRSNKDTRNTPLWNPSSQKLLNIEEDEAGKLRKFREKFGRGWDAERGDGGEGDRGAGGGGEGEAGQGAQDGEESLMDLISGYGRAAEAAGNAAGVRQEAVKSGKGKGGQK